MSSDILKETLKNMAPPAVRRMARVSLKGIRDLRNTIQRRQGQAIGREEIVAALRQLGIRQGDTLIVHSSLSRLGFIEGGVDAVVGALQDAVGETGTLGAPTFWVADPNSVADGTVFDAAQGRSQLGIISERIRLLPGAVRSLHPTHSASFVGPRAKELTADHHLDETPIGPHSPYRKLADIGGKILLLGASLEYLTSFHTIEDEIEGFPFEVYNPDTKRFVVRTAEGAELVLHARLHAPEAARMRQCVKMERHFLDAGVMAKGTVGKGDAAVLDARKTHACLHDLAKRGITMYSPDGPK
jgi:aminoglycoside 3-N-acetyltransferase